MKRLSTAAAFVATFAFSTIASATSWHAGTSYVGKIDAGGFTWDCKNGECKMSGPYGSGLNMDVCKKLSLAVGGVNYYRNSNGEAWTDDQNSTQLKTCNKTQ
jgi:hypothetical protein